MLVFFTSNPIIPFFASNINIFLIPSLRNKQAPSTLCCCCCCSNSYSLFFLFFHYLWTRLMASFKHQPVELKFAVLGVMLIFYLTFSPSKSVGSVSVKANNDNSSKQEKTVLGSRPPKCVNRCFSCRPCMAALVASPHHRNSRISSYQGDESYYLLAWKCKCGNKFFQP